MSHCAFSQQALAWATGVKAFPRWEGDPVAKGMRQSRPNSPANRPVNALTRDAARLPHPIIDTRDSAGKSRSDFSVSIPLAAMGREV